MKGFLICIQSLLYYISSAVESHFKNLIQLRMKSYFNV